MVRRKTSGAFVGGEERQNLSIVRLVVERKYGVIIPNLCNIDPMSRYNVEGGWICDTGDAGSAAQAYCKNPNL